jgi:uncharacterized protein (DUF58 family)
MSRERGAIPGVTVSVGELVRLRAAARGLSVSGSSRPLSPQAGVHRSAYRGRGLEFDEVRVYQPGDDVRSIDWRVTARRGRPHTKLFREERERPVLILVDLSPSMFFGTRVQFKSVLASRSGAIIAWAAAMGGDRAGGVIAGEGRTTALPPKPRQAGVLALLHAITALQPVKPGEVSPGRLDKALAMLMDMSKAGSLVVLLSDFRELGERGASHIRSIAMRNDVVACLIHDALETTPPPPGVYRFGTPSRKVTVDTSSRNIATVWSGEFEAHRKKLRDITRGLAVRWLEFSTDIEAPRLVKAGFRPVGRAV